MSCHRSPGNMDDKRSQTQEIIITRTVCIPPDRVYVAFTSADGWREWCCEQAEVEARIEGKLLIYTEGYNAYGVFKILEQDRVIAFTWNGDKEPPIVIHVLLNAQDNFTLLEFKVNGLGSEQEWAYIAGFLERIWGHALDNLKTVLEIKSEMRECPAPFSLGIRIRNYHAPDDYQAIGQFLIEHYQPENQDGNWIEPVWEYMHGHPYLDSSALGKIGI
jgi:uncharacterized protein YndB with AHSA1/START domain